LAAYVHARGLRFGIYASPGTMTCAQRGDAYPGRTGSAGHERQDAATFAAWGVDYLKYDWCAPGADTGRQVRAFTAMRDAIRATGRPMVYSINPNSDVIGGTGSAAPGFRYDWAGIATMARATQDVLWAWRLDPDGSLAPSVGVSQAIEWTVMLGARSAGDYWNDPDMLVVGVPGVPGSTTPGLSDGEARTQFGMWSMMSAPLIAGNDLTTMPPEVRALLTNAAVLAVDQDRAARAGAPLSAAEPDLWVKPLADGSLAVACYNRDDHAREFAVPTARLGLRPGYRATDLWTGATLGGGAAHAGAALVRTVPAHDTALLRLVPGGR
jgi:alpha-galactosidase